MDQVTKNLGNLQLGGNGNSSSAKTPDAKKVEDLNKVLNSEIPTLFNEQSVSTIATQLEAFQEKLQEGFFAKNGGMHAEQVKIFTDALHKELNELNLQFNQGKLDQTLFNQSTVVIKIKLCMLEQEHLLTDSKQNSLSSLKDSSIHESHKRNLAKAYCALLGRMNFMALGPARVEEENFLKVPHKLENAAAIFSSDPEKMQAYLAERHQEDPITKSNWVKY